MHGLLELALLACLVLPWHLHRTLHAPAKRRPHPPGGPTPGAAFELAAAAAAQDDDNDDDSQRL